MAREMHDTIGQSLASIKIELSLLKKKMTSPDGFDSSDARTRLDEIGTSLDETIASVKAISTELRPVFSISLGWRLQSSGNVKEFSRRLGIKCSYQIPKEELSLSTGASTALFRILQEALTNVVNTQKRIAFE
jgi:signal transduction histidine kinase